MVLTALSIVSAAAPAAPKGAAAATSWDRDPAFAAKLRKFETVVAEYMRAQHIPGMTIAFSKDGKTWSKGFGVADVENATPATARTAYRYASVQKSMTAVAVLQLVEQGKINLDREIQAYVPYYPKKPYQITVRQLLSHLGGIPHYVDRAVEQHFTDHKTTRQAIAVFAGHDLVAVPGTTWSYSTYGYNLLGAAIETASGKSYGDYMRDKVWAPSGMTSARMDDPNALILHRARGYALDDAGQIRNSEFVDVSSRFAGGGTRGTVLDLVRFIEGLREGKLIGPKMQALMFTPAQTSTGGHTGFPNTAGYAMGWNVLRRPTGDILFNDGGQQETRTFMLMVPAKRVSFAMAQNLEKDTDGALVFALFELLTGEKLTLAS